MTMENPTLPAGIVPRRRATYQDLLALPEHVTGELINGELFAMPRPRFRHTDSSAAMLSDIRTAFGRRKAGAGPGGWIIVQEPELHLGIPNADSLVLVPDLAGWRRARMPEVPDTAATGLVPDWVCEILSPGNARHDRVRKMAAYASVGVKWYWIVDADQRTIEPFEHDGRHWVVHEGVTEVDTARIPPFKAVEFDITEWWAVPPPAEPMS